MWEHHRPEVGGSSNRKRLRRGIKNKLYRTRFGTGVIVLNRFRRKRSRLYTQYTRSRAGPCPCWRCPAFHTTTSVYNIRPYPTSLPTSIGSPIRVIRVSFHLWRDERDTYWLRYRAWLCGSSSRENGNTDREWIEPGLGQIRRDFIDVFRSTVPVKLGRSIQMELASQGPVTGIVASNARVTTKDIGRLTLWQNLHQRIYCLRSLIHLSTQFGAIRLAVQQFFTIGLALRKRGQIYFPYSKPKSAPIFRVEK